MASCGPAENNRSAAPRYFPNITATKRKRTPTMSSTNLHTPRYPKRLLQRLSALALVVFSAAVGPAALGQDSAAKEKELLALLRSEAPPGEKAVACKQLAIYGSKEAVADLAPLLANEQLASWARIALEAIPGPEADEALRNSLASLQGKLLVGAINSIGVRGDAAAVESLTARLQDADAEVASAAAVALGHIAGEPASQALVAQLAGAPEGVRSAVAEGCVLCAEKLLAEGKREQALAIYEQVRKAEVPKQRKVEAARGAILSSSDGIPMLLELLQSEDKVMFQLALGVAREYPGGDVDKSLAEALAKTSPERAALLVQAMADRPQTVVLPAALAAAKSGPKEVRLSAIDALKRVGDASCLEVLLEAAVSDDAELAQAAKAALADLPGEGVNEKIVALLPTAKGKMVAVVFEAVGQRRINAAPTLIKALDHSDSAVRRAALAALGETVSLEQLPSLIAQAVAPKNADDAAVALKALKTASVRMPDREACAAKLVEALDKRSTTATKVSLLEILGAVGGEKALAAVGNAARSKDVELADASSRLLGEWMTADAAPVLLDLTKTAPGEKYQARALRGYIRIARQFDLPEQDRVQMCEKALAVARQPAEQKMVLEVLKRYPSPATLKLAIKALQNAELKEEANQATLVIAQNLGAKGVDVGEQLAKAGLEKVKVEIVKAEYGAGSTQKDVTAVVRKQVGDLTLIALPSNSYNESFGGDPVPGSPKQLKIQYKLNGKPGEATFAENSLIVLPLPK